MAPPLAPPQRLGRHEEQQAQLVEALDEATKLAAAAQERLVLERELAQAERLAAFSHLETSLRDIEVRREAVEEGSRATLASEAEESAAKEAHAAARRAAEASNADRKAKLLELTNRTKATAELGREIKELRKRARAQHLQAESAKAAERNAKEAEHELKRSLDIQRGELDGAMRKADASMRKKLEQLTDAHGNAMAAANGASLDLPPLEQVASEARTAAAHANSRLDELKREHTEAQAQAQRLKAASSAEGGSDQLVAVFHKQVI